eukprot:TRINITY_DN6855_c0_g1_i1.p1 TRINITY_DN6855_c0_g1~~TRINITY_DN6855_c0_g1_i1.p1  ORF type:complete len:102 (+),score=13.38 TRINITY_DN6855_c0_g1_i1:75-380(+)
MNNARPESLTWIRSVFTVFTAEKPNEWTVLSNMKPYFNRSISIEDIENTARGRRRLTPPFVFHLSTTWTRRNNDFQKLTHGFIVVPLSKFMLSSIIVAVLC